jgi:hypothetical protein
MIPSSLFDSSWGKALNSKDFTCGEKRRYYEILKLRTGGTEGGFQLVPAATAMARVLRRSSHRDTGRARKTTASTTVMASGVITPVFTCHQ